MKREDVDDARQVELAAYEASKRGDRVDPEWSNDEVWSMILSGCDQPGDHADPSDFDRDDLLEMWRSCANLCPLHLDPAYPRAPSGVWSRDVDRAWRRLAEVTEQHTGKRPSELALATDLGSDEVCGHEFHATTDELRAIFDEHPHARWWTDQQADDGMIDIQVVAA